MRSTESATSACSPRADIFWIIGCIILGALLRLDFLIASRFVIDSDEAIVGLMAKHIAEGKPWPTFYYGQHYMGSLEALCTAALFSLVGPSSWALKTIPLLFSLALIPLLYCLGRELNNRATGRIAALLGALPPAAFVVWSTKARGGFIELIVIGSLALWLGLRWLRSPSRLTMALVGLLLGLGWWVNNQIIYFIAALGAAFVGYAWTHRTRQTFSAAALGSIAFFVGSLPYWLYNLEHHFASLAMFRSGNGNAFSDHFIGLISVALPILFGGVHNWSLDDIFPGSRIIAYLLHGGLLTMAFLFAALRLRRNGLTDPIVVVAMFLVGAWFIFSASSFGWLAQEPRYLLPTYVGMFLLESWLIVHLGRLSPLIARSLLIALLGLHVASCYAGGRAIPGQPFVVEGGRVQADHDELLAWLSTHEIAHIRTNYWIGYRLAFESQEKTTFTLFQPPYERRIPSYEATPLAPWSDVPYLLVPKQAEIVGRALRLLGYTFEVANPSGYVILYNIRPAFPEGRLLTPTELNFSASTHSQAASLAYDGDMTTRWGSAAPQRPGMQFIVEPSPQVPLTGFTLDVGQWVQDKPHGLAVRAVGVDGSTTVLWNASDYQTILYILENSPRIEAHFSPILAQRFIITQTGTDPVFDWSIAELQLYSVLQK